MFGVVLLQIGASALGAALNDAVQFGGRYGLRKFSKSDEQERDESLDAIAGAVASELKPEVTAIMQLGASNSEQLRRIQVQNQMTLANFRQIDAEAVKTGAEEVRQIAEKSAQNRIEQILAEASQGQISDAAQAELQHVKAQRDLVKEEVNGVLTLDFPNGQEEAIPKTGTDA